MKETDDKDLVVSHLEALPHLRLAILRARELGRSVEVKNFPECLLAEDADALENEQPKLVIDPAFWPEFMRNGFNQCVHRVSIAHIDLMQCGWKVLQMRQFVRVVEYRAVERQIGLSQQKVY